MTDQTHPQEHPLALYNTLTRKKEPFKPINDKRVTMYNCGPTVYSYAHIGNARAAVVADVLFRVLRHIYPERDDWKEGEEPRVVYARNITDVDDRIIASAKEQGKPISEITEKYARIYNEDLAAISCLPPTYQPKATENIGGMIDMIAKLIKDGFAYESEGHVFFDVSKFDDYGKLSGNTMDQLKAAGRVGEGEVARKKNSADFVLWKPELDGVGWDAPFGKGRPGWHIECSAMSKAVLGETIDIHCGGVDLKFPHHENEIAQSECAHGQPMANYWVHNEFLNMGKEKMSKSLGNVTLIHDLLKDWDGEVIRLALLKAHYRSELIWSEGLLKESRAQLDHWYRVLQETEDIPYDDLANSSDLNVHHLFEDLQTPEFTSWLSLEAAIVRKNYDAVLEIYEKYGNEISQTSTKAYKVRQLFVKEANLLGLLQKDPDEWFKGKAKAGGLTDSGIETLIEERAAVRAAKNWARADEIRDLFAKENIILEDGKNGTTDWRRG